ncbi:hypothetical protein RF55_18106, partial [Lasius niger]
MGNEVKEVLLAQSELYTRLARFYENLKKTGSDKITLGVAEARLHALEQCWVKFDSRHEKLLVHQATHAGDEYFKLDTYSLAEESYLIQKGQFLDLIRELKVKASVESDKNYEKAWSTLRDYYENKRFLVRSYLANFLALQKMKSESAVELRKILHNIKTTVSSLETIGRPVTSNEDLFVHLAIELLDARSRREWESSISATTEPPSYASLALFLDRRLHTLESMLLVKVDTAVGKAGSSNGNSSNGRSTRSHHARKQETKSENTRGRCTLCQADHFIMFCEEYKKKAAAERKQHVSDNNLCANCLGRHKIAECTSKKSCTVCNSRHHTSLHDAFRESEVHQTSHVTQRPSARQAVVLLATARVRVADRHGVWHITRALIDQGSESSIISERLAQRLKLTRYTASVAIFGVGGQKTGVSKGRVSLAFQPRTGGKSMTASALVLPKLTVYAGGLDDRASSWPHLADLVLADPDFGAADPIDVLLGADVYATILGQGLRKGGPRDPVAQQTTLGWILSGAVGESVTAHHVSSLQCRTEEDLGNLVRRFWETDEIQPAAKPFSKADLECEEHFRRTHARAADGRYIVRLPTIEPIPDLSGTKRTACRVLKHMERKFELDATFRTMYTEFMLQYEELGHMTRVPLTSQDSLLRTCYLPHHGVLRETSASTKLRVVFNGSSNVPSGDNLNKFLMIGPNLLPALADILLQWRQHR